MISEIFDLVLLIAALGLSGYAIFFSSKLWIRSRKVILSQKDNGYQIREPKIEGNEPMSDDDRNIVRIFQDLEKKAIELDGDFEKTIESYKSNQVALESYQQYMYNNFHQAASSTSNHVTN